ncbi:aldo/keto reductase [Paenibacillus sp. FSL E2-0201]|uniref:aldo/keto reductase n=1 Tax=Paenibacillus sp. FSL E2-0201 TaxID=2954726 RepID=UPI0030DDBB97
MAKEKGSTPSQLALAWTLAKGALPIPGTRRISYLEENAGAVDIVLTPDDLARIEAVSPQSAVQGGRYDDSSMKGLNI